ncbi:hypothetical protein PAV_6c01590 [Paenibacillus alvei DSM 29]|nr:hypothetical protein PAV_6c01590 [Paenibacillus alvei DSM 29]
MDRTLERLHHWGTEGARRIALIESLKLSGKRTGMQMHRKHKFYLGCIIMFLAKAFLILHACPQSQIIRFGSFYYSRRGEMILQ